MKELFVKKHPQLVKEIHPDLNKDIDFSVLYENSGRHVIWQCKKNSKHVWKQKIGNRAIKGYGCPYCSGRLTLSEDSFPVLFPSLFLEFHPSKNKNIDPYKCRPGSNKVVWWRCENGHEWKQSIHHRVLRDSKCRECRKINNSLARKYPEIAKEWHTQKNNSLKPSQVVPSSTNKVWWQCLNNPNHEWQASVKSRVFSKSPCPKCKKKTQQNGRLPALSVFSPELASQWHPSKNGNLLPSSITAGSGQKVWWRCPNDPSHEWQATVRNRARQGKGCPKCSYRSPANPDKSLAVLFPNIAAQWHPKNNHPLTPHDVTYGSSRLVWWLCPNDSSHEWQATVVSRTQRNRTECPKCPESKTSINNSLKIAHPDIAAQWHPTKNDELTPEKVTRASGRKVWWQCPKDPSHEWQAQVKNRTVLGSGCPYCFQELNTIRLSEKLYDLTSSEIDCYHILLNNLRVLSKLLDLEINSQVRLSQPYYRMLYSSAIVYLEAYLSDAFCNEVLPDSSLVEKIILTTPEFTKKQYSLSEVVDWNKNINKKIQEYLVNILWHNLAKVEKMYKSILSISFPNDLDHLYRAVNIRHDIVHRNGRSKTGKIRKIRKNNILKLISKIRELADHINKELSAKKAEQSR